MSLRTILSAGLVLRFFRYCCDRHYHYGKPQMIAQKSFFHQLVSTFMAGNFKRWLNP